MIARTIIFGLEQVVQQRWLLNHRIGPQNQSAKTQGDETDMRKTRWTSDGLTTPSVIKSGPRRQLRYHWLLLFEDPTLLPVFFTVNAEIKSWNCEKGWKCEICRFQIPISRCEEIQPHKAANVETLLFTNLSRILVISWWRNYYYFPSWVKLLWTESCGLIFFCYLPSALRY